VYIYVDLIVEINFNVTKETDIELLLLLKINEISKVIKVRVEKLHLRRCIIFIIGYNLSMNTIRHYAAIRLNKNDENRKFVMI